jgi:uncharacterized membrane protein
MNDSSALLPQRERISAIDLVRGLVMVIMALDHTRDFFHIGSFAFDPTDLTKTTPALFFTRWITHYCAPTFVFLAGAGIRISQQRRTKRELSRFLWTRGLWLIFLEFTVVRFSFFYNFYYDATIVQVIYATGMSMVILSALIYLKENVLLILGIVIVAAHNLLDGIQLKPGDTFFAVWHFIHQSGPVEIAPGKFFIFGYPALPWLGVLLCGYSLGRLYLKPFDPMRRQRILLRLGILTITLFVGIRFINIYGDPVPWAHQSTGLFTFLSFINCTKYPISLLYVLMTLGPMLILLAVLEIFPSIQFRPLEVFGRVPMFYYILHFFLVHSLAIAAFIFIRGKSFSDLDFHFFHKHFGGLPYDAGYSLRWVYVAWAIVVLICYPLCVRYNAYKSTHTQWWLSYL